VERAGQLGPGGQQRLVVLPGFGEAPGFERRVAPVGGLEKSGGGPARSSRSRMGSRFENALTDTLIFRVR